MKCFFLSLLLIFAFLSNAQQPGKLPRDSVKYYQQQLNQLWRANYDSLKNSEKYKAIIEKLHTKNRKVVTVELLFNVGVYFTNFKNLNERLKSIGQEPIKTAVPSWGVSLAVGKPVLTYGLEVGSYFLDARNTTYKGVHGRFYLATNLFKKSPVVLHPQIGYGGSFLNMFVHRPYGQANFNDVFQSQANTVQLNHSQSYLDFALGLKFRSPKTENFYWQFLRVGYRYGLKNTDWATRGGSFNNAPPDRNNQFYIQFCLGFDRE